MKFQKVALGYTAFILLWFLSQRIIGDRFWGLALLNMAAEYFFVPLPFLILLGFYWKRLRALAWLALPTAIFLSFWGQLYLPTFPAADLTGLPSLKVMTYNVLVSNRNPEQVVEVVLKEMPDVIGFQELSRHNIPPLEQGLRGEYPYNAFADFSGGRSDVGLVSRYPIVSVERFSFPPEERAMHTVVDWNGQHLHIFIVHLSANNLLQQSLSGAPALATQRFQQRADQIQRISDEIAGISEPILVLCDCNMLDTSTAYADMEALFVDSFKESGWGSGHTSMAHAVPFPYQRIDYIWHSEAFLSTQAYVGENHSSDHFPVIARLSLKK